MADAASCWVDECQGGIALCIAYHKGNFSDCFWIYSELCTAFSPYYRGSYISDAITAWFTIVDRCSGSTCHLEGVAVYEVCLHPNRLRQARLCHIDGLSLCQDDRVANAFACLRCALCKGNLLALHISWHLNLNVQDVTTTYLEGALVQLDALWLFVVQGAFVLYVVSHAGWSL